ncbi:MAG: glycosyltransferase [Dysgonamonadaceae bacterium]|jgi:glycosyltransferase involved in cell wall biosynthesis|nr:glycosyltransferase [Dysgonamonadaceae bacterium]
MTFSIITVTCNAAQWIERTIQSIISQSYSGIEYIIVDGGSTDGTLDIITDYKLRITDKGCRFRWISEPDGGIYDAMNKGLKLATGDYVWFINAGDSIHSPDTIREIVNQLSTVNRQPSIIYGETEISDTRGNSSGMRRLKAPEKLTWKSFKMGMLVSHQSFIVKREIAGAYDLQYRYAADFEWCIRCLKKADHILNTHLILSYFLEAGFSAANRKASLKERYEAMCRYYGKIPTQIRHLWFAVRFYFAKWIKRKI